MPDVAPASTIYLDHAATTPLLPAAAEAMAEAYQRFHANPASQHGPGRAARRVLEQARSRIGELLGASVAGMAPDRVIFTSGGTEANNWALAGLGCRDGSLVVSAAEHPSIAAAARRHAESGRPVEVLRLHENGLVDLAQLRRLLEQGNVALVSIQLGNNETGIVQPVAECARLCASHDVPLHTDAVQAVGKVDVNFQELGVAAMTVAGHKFHGPPGIGVLLVRSRTQLRPLLAGGYQQEGLRPGTELVALASGMWQALETWSAEAGPRLERLVQLRRRLERGILAEAPDVTVIGQDQQRLPHIANLAFRGIDRQALAMALDLAGIACSTGSACASGSSEPSPTLVAMGLPEDVVGGSIRVSLGATTTAAEIDQAAGRILATAKHLRPR